MFPTPTPVRYIFFILHPKKTHTTEHNNNRTTPHQTLFLRDLTIPKQLYIYIFHTPPQKKQRKTPQLPLCPQETKLYDTERLVVAVFTSLLLGLEGGNASMMEECQVTWPEPSLKLTVGLHLKNGGPPGSWEIPTPKSKPWFLGCFCCYSFREWCSLWVFGGKKSKNIPKLDIRNPPRHTPHLWRPRHRNQNVCVSHCGSHVPWDVCSAADLHKRPSPEISAADDLRWYRAHSWSPKFWYPWHTASLGKPPRCDDGLVL